MSCLLCIRERKTEWFYEDKICWVAICENCGVPMVVKKKHEPNADADERVHMQNCLRKVARMFFDGDFTIDTNMRAIPEHLHWHARPV